MKTHESCLEADVIISVHVSSSGEHSLRPLCKTYKEVTLTTSEWRPTPGPGAARGLKAGSRQAMPGLKICSPINEEHGEFWIWRQLQHCSYDFEEYRPQPWTLSVDTIFAPAAWGISALPPGWWHQSGLGWWLWLHWLQVRSATPGPEQRRTQGRGGECSWPHLHKVKIEECGAISGVLEGEEGGTQWAALGLRSSLHQRKR